MPNVTRHLGTIGDKRWSVEGGGDWTDSRTSGVCLVFEQIQGTESESILTHISPTPPRWRLVYFRDTLQEIVYLLPTQLLGHERSGGIAATPDHNWRRSFDRQVGRSDQSGGTSSLSRPPRWLAMSPTTRDLGRPRVPISSASSTIPQTARLNGSNLPLIP